MWIRANHAFILTRLSATIRQGEEEEEEEEGEEEEEEEEEKAPRGSR